MTTYLTTYYYVVPRILGHPVYISIRTQIIVKTKKVKEAEKFVSHKIFEYDNCQISEYDYVKSISYR
jgi:hypothetical protein